MASSPFGLFIVLPYEIRLLIWEDLIRQGSLAILRTSRALYHDIADRLYDTFDIHLSPLFEDPWIDIRCRLLHANWVIEERDYPRWMKLARLPYHRVKLVIHLYAPDPDDPAQFAILWAKASRLVRIINAPDDAREDSDSEDEDSGYWSELDTRYKSEFDIYEQSDCYEDSQKPSMTMSIHLRKKHCVDWLSNGEVTSTLRSFGYGADFNEILLPFCRLTGVGSFCVIPDTPEMDEIADWGFINYASAFIASEGFVTLNDTIYSRAPEYRDLVRTFDDIASLVTERDDFMKHLPFKSPIHGRTAKLICHDYRAHMLEDIETKPKLLCLEKHLHRMRHVSLLRDYSDTTTMADPDLESLVPAGFPGVILYNSMELMI